MGALAAVDVCLQEIGLGIVHGHGDASDEWIPPLEQFVERSKFVRKGDVLAESFERVVVVEECFCPGGLCHGESLAWRASMAAKEMKTDR